MATEKPLILKDGKPSQLPIGDDLRGIDYHSGQRQIDAGETLILKEKKEMRVRRILRNDGVLITEGVLIID